MFLNALKKRGDELRNTVITGHSTGSVIETLQNIGMTDAFMVKPIAIAQLQKVFRKYVCPLSQFYSPDQVCFDPAYGANVVNQVRRVF